jgi:hypothetical protein
MSKHLNIKIDFIESSVYQTEKEICQWVFKGMVFSKNINGWTLYKPSIALTFSSNICIIPDRLIQSRACFRLYRLCKDNKKNPILDNMNELFCKQKNAIFVNPKKNCNKMFEFIYQYLSTNCKLFLGRVRKK